MRINIMRLSFASFEKKTIRRPREYGKQNNIYILRVFLGLSALKRSVQTHGNGI